MASSKKTPMKEKNGAIKASLKRTTRSKRKSTAEKKIGTTSGATVRYIPVAQTDPLVIRKNSLIQVDKMLNITNRRIYRQHKVYTVQVELDSKATPLEPGRVVQLFALRNTWANRKAFALAKEMYDKAVIEERAQVGNARWHDFRISGLNCFANTDTNGVFPVTTSHDETRKPTLLGNGEYTSSEISITGTTGTVESRKFSLLPTTNTGASANQYSVFLEFANNGPRTPTDPANPSPGGYERVSGTDYEVGNVQDLLDNGNFPPYDTGSNQAVLSGGPWVKVGELFHNATGESQLRTGYFEAPLGMIVAVGYDTVLDPTTPTPIDSANNLIAIRVKEGDYKGVEAEDI